MVVVLNVAEKPSIAKTLGSVLSNNQSNRNDGLSRYNPLYLFSCEFPLEPGGPVGRHDMIMTSVSGHLMSMDFQNNSGNWSAVDPLTLFEAPVLVSVRKDASQIEKTLQREVRKADYLIIWTDCDREGEAIGHEIATVCKNIKRYIRVKRARFSVANAANIWSAVNNLVELDMNQVAAVEARTEIDFRLGAIFTRFQTLNLSNRFVELDKKTISFGPCQFPTLGLVVDRFEKIEAFVSEDFWYLDLSYLDSTTNQTTKFNWQRNRVFDRETGVILYEMCIDAQVASVLSVTRKPKTKWRPLPLSTVELQIRMSKFCRISSERTMHAAEALYQRGIISYPRTETDSFADSFDLHALVNVHRESEEFGAYVSTLIDGNRFTPPRKGGHDDKAHPPIHPTSSMRPATLRDNDERAVYEFVVRHFLACCSEDARGSETNITIGMGSERFTATGLEVLQRNYLDIYKYEKWGEHTLPNLQEGLQFTPHALLMNEGKTQAPNLLSEPDLIRLMDKNGIGTDATIQDHIKTILDREYARKSSETVARFSPTVLGRSLIVAYRCIGHENTISKPNTRAKMERHFESICQGQKTKQEVIDETLNQYRVVYQDTRARSAQMFQALETAWHHQTTVPAANSPVTDQQGPGNGLRHAERANFATMREYRVERRNFSTCGHCGEKKMALRSRKMDGQAGPRGGSGKGKINQRYLTCEKCSTGYRLPKGSPQPVNPDFFCPLCKFQTLQISNDNKSYAICPRCYNYPDSSSATGTEIESYNTMPCFKCCEKTCRLARGIPNADTPLTKCSVCGDGKMMLRKTQNGNYMIGCAKYPACTSKFFLPSAIKSCVISENCCGSCQSRRVQIEFNPGSVPMGQQLIQEVCIGRTCPMCPVDLSMMLYGEYGASYGTTQPRQAGTPAVAQPQNSSNNRQTGVMGTICPTHNTACELKTAQSNTDQGRRYFKCPVARCHFLKWHPQDEPQKSSYY